MYRTCVGVNALCASIPERSLKRAFGLLPSRVRAVELRDVAISR